MTSIGRHRSCGCDCRDSAIYSPDPLVFNPICCKVCGEDGTSKPPCVYLVNWECDLWEGEGPFTLGDHVRYARHGTQAALHVH
jgi:hypothetical protein